LRWTAFSHKGKQYDLDHLHPKTVNYFQPAKGTNPPRGYKVEVIYSLHCFTRGLEDWAPNPDLLYSDGRETRIFDFHRYELSRQLPGVIENLMSCKCFHTERGNFFTIKALDDQGNKIEYEIYFAASKSSKAGVINLYIQSAYVRDAKHRPSRPRVDPKPIGFPVILYNTLNRVPIKAPQ
jgi:hypothetical protein